LCFFILEYSLNKGVRPNYQVPITQLKGAQGRSRYTSRKAPFLKIAGRYLLAITLFGLTFLVNDQDHWAFWWLTWWVKRRCFHGQSRLQTAAKKSGKKSSYSNKHLLYIQIAELKSMLWKTINFYALAEINN